jgi:hypothetical protein
MPHNVAGNVGICIGSAQRLDNALTTTSRWPELHEQDLIVARIDLRRKFTFELGFFDLGQVAFEHGILEVRAIILATQSLPTADGVDRITSYLF